MEKTKEIKDYLTFMIKVKVLKFGQTCKNNKEAYELFGVKKSTFYKLKKAFEKDRKNGLIRKKPIAYNFPN